MGCAGLQGMSSTPTRVRRRVEEGPSEIPCRVRKLALLSREGQRRPAHIGEALPALRQRVIPREVQAPQRW